MYLLILLLLFALTVAVLYVPYVHWHRWQGGWRLLGLLPPLPLLIYVGMAVAGMFAEPPQHRLDPGVAVLVVLASAALDGLLRLAHRYFGKQGKTQ
ncbi:MAG: hypothetical protein PVH46_05300 [Granulosicoccaceae bacterium]|jgi:hypothetical protein